MGYSLKGGLDVGVSLYTEVSSFQGVGIEEFLVYRGVFITIGIPLLLLGVENYLEDTCPLFTSQLTIMEPVYESGKFRNLYLRFVLLQPDPESRNLGHIALVITPTSF